MSGTAQPQPAPGAMRRIPFPLASYVHDSLPLSAKRLINLMAEQQPSDARTEAALVPTPGLVPAFTIGTGPIYAINFDLPGRVYAVSGDHLYRCSFPPAINARFEDMGYVGNAARPYDLVTIAVGSTAAVVCVPPRAYTCGHAENGAYGADPMHQIGGDFPGAATVAHMDGYYAFTDYSDNARFFLSHLLDPSQFDALDFAFSDAMPNVVRRVIGHRGQFWMMGEAGHEVWYDSGDADFPFRRLQGSTIPYGALTPRSEAVIDGSIWWVGVGGVVYRTNGYKAERVSNHAIEAIITQGGQVDQAYAYQIGGHAIYCIQQGRRTLVYDCATQQWHERSSSTDGSLPWRPISACNFGGGALLGDSISGKCFFPTPFAADDGIAVIRQATLPNLWAGTNRAFCSRLEVEMETGGAHAPASVLLEWSDDGARTWTGSRTLSAGGGSVPADYRHRVVTTRLGSFRQRTFRLTTQGPTTLYAVDAALSGAAS